VVPGEHTTVRADLAEFLVRALADGIGNIRPWPSPVPQHSAQAHPTQCVLRPPELPSQPDSDLHGAPRSGGTGGDERAYSDTVAPCATNVSTPTRDHYVSQLFAARAYEAGIPSGRFVIDTVALHRL
jgi:hypothetical protein